MRRGTKAMKVMVLAALAGLAGAGCSDEGQGALADTGGAADTGVTFSDVTGPADTLGVSDTGGQVGDSATPEDATAPVDTLVLDDTAAPPADTATPADTAQAQGPRIEVDPAQYTFTYISPLTTAPTRQVTIYNLGTQNLTITGISWLPGSSSDFDIALLPPLPKTLAPQQSTLLNVRFREIAGGTATLRITSNDPVRPTVDIVFDSRVKAGTGSPDPCIQIVPSQLNFGQVERGQQKTLQATVTNCSSAATLEIKEVKRSTFFFLTLSDEFQITNLPATPFVMQPGASIPIDVTYAPLLAGLDSGSFLFVNTDPLQPEAKLDVSAVGKAPPPEEIGLRVKISWNTNDTDVDSHLIAPGGTLFDCTSDCFFANPSPDWGVAGAWQDDPFLDVDDVDGYGPENINISEPIAGTYTFIVHYYADSHDGPSQPAATTVEVYSYNTLLKTFGPTTTQSTNDVWDVFTIEWPSKVITTLGNVYHVGSGPGMCSISFP